MYFFIYLLYIAYFWSLSLGAIDFESLQVPEDEDFE
jgi:hypothetical protein